MFSSKEKKWTVIFKINHNKEQWGGVGRKQKAGVLRAPHVQKNADSSNLYKLLMGTYQLEPTLEEVA